MKKRMLSLMLVCCMLLTMLPAHAYGAEPEEALYAQMLELGLVDDGGALIEDNTFTVEDGTALSSLDELVNWLNQCEEGGLDTVITVDATGRSATAEQLMYALSIEYQMSDLAETLNRLASGTNSLSLAAANSAVDTTAHDLKLAPTIGIEGSILTLEVLLVDKTNESRRVNAPHDVKVQVGMFSDILAAYDEDYAAEDGGQVPGTNYFKDYTIPAGSSSIEFKMDLSKLRQNYLSLYDGLWDGNANLLFQARTAPYDAKMPASSFTISVPVAPQENPDSIISKLTGDIEIGKKVSDGTAVQPYHLDWSQYNSAAEKVSINETDYFKITTAVPAEKGFDYSNDGLSYTTHGWMDEFSRALRLGVGDLNDPKVELENVTIWTKESNEIQFPSLYIMEGSDLVEIARNPSTYRLDDFADGSSTAAYLADLTRVQSTNWDLTDSEAKNQNFYKKIKEHSWNLARFTGVEVPITATSSNYVIYPQDWYLNADWITQNENADLRPEELLMHGALTLVDDTAPTIQSIETCARTPKYTGSDTYYYSYFYPGNKIPIVVTFSEPVYGDYQLAYLYGTETKYLSSDPGASFVGDVTRDGGILSNTRVFYYYVLDTDCTGIQVLGVKPVDDSTCKDVFGNKFKASTDGAYKEFHTTILDGYILGGALEQSVRSMTASVDPQDPRKVTFTVNLSNAETFQTEWLDWSKDTNARKVTVALDGDPAQSVELELDVTGSGSDQAYILTGTMTLPEADYDTTRVAELYFDDSLHYGAYAAFTQKPVTFAGTDAYTIGINADGWPSGIDNIVFQQDAKVPVIEYTDNGKDYTYKHLGTSDVRWTVSDPEVIQLAAYEGGGTDLSLTQTVKASVIPLKAGTATLSLLCGNNGTRDTTASNSITVIVKDSGRPTLLFPQGADTIYARLGAEQAVHFASNLSGHAPADGRITASLYQGSGVAADAEPVWETTLERSATSLTIPGDQLTSISAGDAPAYILRLTATAQVDNTTQKLSTDAKIVVRSQPAVITLTGLDDPMFISGQDIVIGWKVENFDLAANPEACQFAFTVEKDGQEVYSTEEKTASGSYTLTPATPTGLKDYYVITAKAKNGADPTWSIASSTVTVYQAGALDILVGGEKQDSVTLKNEIGGGTTTTAPTGATYSGNAIGGLTSAQAIAQLRSELSLMERIGINFGEYDWSILYDTVQWSTSTGQGEENAASVNYREGSLYAPLEQYPYTCYLPQTILLLCGLRDGSNTVTATHSALPSLSDSVTVSVETLKNKLYLFQFTPAVKTEVSYEDSRGETHTVYSNDDGSLALFEPDGIASNLWAAAVSGGVSYRGTTSQLALKSGEGNGTRGELYPLNTMELRRAATAQVQLLRPDGTPLAKTDVTLRGGVYRNRYAAGNRDDAYCTSARFAKAAGQSASLDGTEDQIFTTDENGMLTVHMDLSQFTTQNDAGPVGVGDSLEFIFEVRPKDCYPEIITVDGSLTQRDAMRSGEHIVTLTAAQAPKPFVAVQTINYTGREIDVRKHTGVVGPSSNYPSALLESTIMLWGAEGVAFTDAGYHVDLRARETGVSVPGQSGVPVRDATYPFSSIPLVSNRVTLTSGSFDNYDGTRKTPLETALYDGSGTLTNTVALPFGLADLTAIEKVEDAPSVMSLMANLAAYGTVGGANTEYEYANKVSDGIMLDALSFLEEMGGETGLVKAILMPTEDPTRYEAYLWTGINTTKLEDLDYDRNGICLEPSYFGQDYDSLLGQVNDTFTLSDFQAMADGSYFDERSNLYGAVANGVIGLPIMLQLEGWMTTEIRYNFDQGQWQVLTTGGGFTAGAQLEFEKVLRASAYGIPLTASFMVRGGAVVDFQAAIRYAEQLGLEWNDDTANAVNDYLTALRISAYFEFFGGVGYDQGFTAKIGVFGTIEINNENRFLTRKYLKDPSDRDMAGQFLQLDGEAGIKAALGVGPVVTEITLVSLGFGAAWRFNEWDTINDYWEEASSGLGSTGWIDNDLANQSMMLYNSGQGVLAVSEPVVRLQSRDYLDEGDRVWLGGGMALMSLDAPGRLSAIQTNAYPFSTPMLSDDGRLLVYLSDADSSDVTDVEVRYSLGSGGSFPDGSAIPAGTDNFSGYGDSSLDFEGTSNFAGAIWLREAATVGLKAGAALNEGQQTALLGGLEVVASIWDGSQWATTRLTDNGSQEFDPVIAVNNDKAIAVWRSVQTDENAYHFTQNRILCKVFDGTSWSDETYTLYNGSAGEVTGMTAGMLSGGTAAVAFSVKDGAGSSDIYYTVVDTTAASPEDSAKTIRATTSKDADENPQLAAVGEQFVMGWSSVQSITGAEQHDVGLRVFDKTGAPQPVLPESLSDMVSTAAFDGQFTFVKGADALDELSILWNDAKAGSGENDVVRAIKFVGYGDSYLSSAAIEVAELPERTGLDHMDACITNGDGTSIQAVIQGTTYSEIDETDPTTFDAVSYSYELNGKTYTGTGRIPKETVNLLSASETYTDAVEVLSTTVDYTTLATDSYVPVNFTVSNQGMHVIDSVTIQLDGADPQNFTGLTLLPGQHRTLSVVTKTDDEIKNLNYTVKAMFSGAAERSTAGTVYLDYPDVGVSALTITKEQDGERTVLANLYNQSAASLNKNDRRVVLGVYSDPECETPLNGKYFAGGTADTAYELTLTDDALETIDGTGYTRELTFRIGDYLKDAGLKEIPDSNVMLFVRARIEQQVNGKWIVLPEADSQNNQKHIIFDSLLTRNENAPTTLSVEMKNGNTTTAGVQVRNNSLQPRTSGNLVAALLDRNGNLLETKTIGDLSLGAEEVKERSIVFSNSGARVVLRYGEAEPGGSTANANAAGITIDGLPLTMGSFDEHGSATVDQVPSGQYLLTVIPEGAGATVTVNGKPAENGMASIRGGDDERTVSVLITAADGSTTRAYTIYLNPAQSANPGSGHGYDDNYTLTFETNGGNKITSLRKISGTTVDLAAYTPTRSGYIFTGWYADKSLTEKITRVKLTRNITIYAGWQEAGASPFTDVLKGSYYEEAVNWAVERGITGGTSATTFSPNAPCTRAQIVTFLWRAAGSPAPKNSAMPFTDVAAGSYYETAVLWAVENGITGGTGNGKFSPDAACTRAQAVTFLYRFAGSPAASGSSFGDVDGQAYYAGAVSWAVDEGITAGTGGNRFSPDATCTRAQIVTFLYRADSSSHQAQ